MEVWVDAYGGLEDACVGLEDAWVGLEDACVGLEDAWVGLVDAYGGLEDARVGLDAWIPKYPDHHRLQNAKYVCDVTSLYLVRNLILEGLKRQFLIELCQEGFFSFRVPST